MRREPFSQHESAPQEPCLYRRDTQPQLAGHFIRRKLLDIPEHHHNAILRGKTRNPLFNELPNFLFRAALLGIILPSSHLSRPKVVIFLTLSFIQALNFSPASQTLECRIPGDTHQPSRKLRAALESHNVLECTQ